MNTYQIESSSNVVVRKVTKNSQSTLLSDDDEDEGLIPEVNFGVDAEFNLNFFESNTPSSLSPSETKLTSEYSSTCSDTNPSSVGSAFEFISSPPTPTKNSQTQTKQNLGKLFFI